MITMDKKYRQRNGRKFYVAAIRGDADPDNAVVGWGENVNGALIACARRIDGTYPHCMMSSYDNPSQYDLIEVVPEVVKWYGVYDDASITDCEWSLADVKSAAREEGALPRSAILKVTVRNGEVIADVLPVDYAEPTP